MKSWLKKYWIIIAIVVIIASWSIFFYFISPESLVDKIGVKNSYLIAFLAAVFAGVSSLTGTSFYATIIALSQGGVNAWILGLVGGVGLFISDSIFYFLALKGVRIISDYKKNLFDKIEHWLMNVRPEFVYLGILAYTSLPLPNDILLIALAISSFSYKKFAIFLLIGDITISTILSHLTG